MFKLIVTEKGGTPKRLEFDKDEVTIGRVPGNDVILPKGNVSKRHSRVVRQDGRFFVVDLKSTNGTYLNGRRITTPSVIRPGDKIYVGDFVVVVDTGEAHASSPPSSVPSAGEDSEHEMLSVPPPPEPMRPSAGIDRMALDEEPAPAGGGSSGLPHLSTGGTIAPSVAAMPPAKPTISTQAVPGGHPTASPSLHTAAPTSSGAGNATLRQTQPPPRAVSPGRSTTASHTGPVSQSGPGASARGPLNSTNHSTNHLAPAGRTNASASNALPSPQPSRTTQGPSAAVPPFGAGSANASHGASHTELPQPESFRRTSPVGGTGSDKNRQIHDSESPEADRDGGNDHEPLTMPPAAARGTSGLAGAGLSTGAGAGAALRSSGMPPAVTRNMSHVAVDAVLKSAQLAESADTLIPPREYAALLADVIAEARAAGANAPADRLADSATRSHVRNVVEGIVHRRDSLPPQVSAERLVRDATAEIAGAGALELAFEDSEVTTAVVDVGGRVLVGRGGALGPSPLLYSSDAAVVTTVDRLLQASGVPRPPYSVVEAMLADGSRLLAVLPPVAASGPTLVLERTPTRPPTLAGLASRGTLSEEAAKLLRQALAAQRNVIVSGPQGSGRTTVLAALLEAVSAGSRFVLVEEGQKIGRAFPSVTVLDAMGEWPRALEVARRLRPERLAISGTNEASAAAVVAMMTTGSEGLLVATEGSSPRGSLVRIATLAAAATGGTRDEALARLAVSRPLVVHLGRFGDGACRVVSIAEASPGEGAEVVVEEIFTLKIDRNDAQGRLDASLTSTGASPSFART